MARAEEGEGEEKERDSVVKRSAGPYRQLL